MSERPFRPEPTAARQWFHHVAGGLILPLNKLRHTLAGYRTPRTFPLEESSRAAAYDAHIVAGWRRMGEAAFGDGFGWRGASVLELGPGDNLGTGLLLIAGGADAYTAVDAHALASGAPDAFYDVLLDGIDEPDLDAERARAAWRRFREGGGREEPGTPPAIEAPPAIEYLIDPRFDLGALAGRGFDRIVSQAAFEHFDDIDRTIRGMTAAAAPGARFVAEIDLKTHTRWIRDVDPLNIYRYSESYYRLWKFSGSPNRRRPDDYVRALETNGWRDIRVTASESAPAGYVRAAAPRLARRFRRSESAMDMLVIVVTASLPDPRPRPGSRETSEARVRP